MLDSCKLLFPQVILTQPCILHREYLTLICMATFRSMHSPVWPMCFIVLAHLIILYGPAPKIQRFRSQVVHFLHDKIGLLGLSLNPEQCLLGLYSDPDSEKFTTTFIHKSVFTVRKLIACSLMWLFLRHSKIG